MPPKVWATTDDETIELVSVTCDKLPEVMDLMRNEYLTTENVVTAIGLSKDPIAVNDMMEYFEELLVQGCSIVALDKETRAVAGVAINKIQDQSTRLKDIEEMQQYATECKSPAMLTMLQFAGEVASSYNLYSHCGVECVMEITFLSTAAKYRGRGIAKKLSEASIALCRFLTVGKNVKTPLDDKPLPLGPVPQAVYAVFTSFITQKIGKSLGFREIVRKGFDSWSSNGKSLAEILGPATPNVTVEYLVL